MRELFRNCSRGVLNCYCRIGIYYVQCWRQERKRYPFFIENGLHVMRNIVKNNVIKDDGNGLGFGVRNVDVSLEKTLTF